MSDIFISYKREEQPIARKLADALEGEGWSVWWDPKLRAGERFNDVIEKALKESKCVVVMWSKRSVESQYVKHEANYALRRNKLVPVIIEKVELPFRFEDLHTLTLLEWDGSRDFSEFRRLVEDIAAIVGSPATESKWKADDFLSFIGIKYGDTIKTVQRKFGKPDDTRKSKKLTHDDYFDGGLTISYGGAEKTVRFISVDGEDVIEKIRSKGIVDEKVEYLGQHRNTIIKTFGQPSSERSDNIEYGLTRDDSKIGSITFSCYQFNDYSCTTIEVFWNY